MLMIAKALWGRKVDWLLCREALWTFAACAASVVSAFCYLFIVPFRRWLQGNVLGAVLAACFVVGGITLWTAMIFVNEEMDVFRKDQGVWRLAMRYTAFVAAVPFYFLRYVPMVVRKSSRTQRRL